MNTVSIVLFVIVCGAVAWLTVDTVIYVVKKVKARKQRKKEKESGVVVDDNANND